MEGACWTVIVKDGATDIADKKIMHFCEIIDVSQKLNESKSGMNASGVAVQTLEIPIIHLS